MKTAKKVNQFDLYEINLEKKIKNNNMEIVNDNKSDSIKLDIKKSVSVMYIFLN